MSEIEREIRRQRWMARQRMLAAMVAIQEARRTIQIEQDDGHARVARVGAYRWVFWTDCDGNEDATCLGRVTS